VRRSVHGRRACQRASRAEELVRFAYSDPGLSYYGNGIIATEETIKSNPDLVRASSQPQSRG
jgi:NitT/TauT family transport system substrate-binding protein